MSLERTQRMWNFASTILQIPDQARSCKNSLLNVWNWKNDEVLNLEGHRYQVMLSGMIYNCKKSWGYQKNVEPFICKKIVFIKYKILPSFYTLLNTSAENNSWAGWLWAAGALTRTVSILDQWLEELFEDLIYIHF